MNKTVNLTHLPCKKKICNNLFLQLDNFCVLQEELQETIDNWQILSGPKANKII